jgi:hypothetical protein
MQYAAHDKKIGAAVAWYGPLGRRYKDDQSYRAEVVRDGWTRCVDWLIGICAPQTSAE